MADEHSKPGMCEDDVDGALRDVAELEVALGLEIARLHGPSGRLSSATRATTGVSRPLWWWRTVLAQWVRSEEARAAHPEELLQGFRMALEDFDEPQLLSYLETVQAALRDTA